MKKILLIAFAILFFTVACKEKQPKTGASTRQPVKRFGMVTGLKPEKLDYYKQLHAAVWPEVMKKIKECNIQNYSIYLKEIDGKPYLFSYFEYTGTDFDSDMQKMAADSTTKRCGRKQIPVNNPYLMRLPKDRYGLLWMNCFMKTDY